MRPSMFHVTSPGELARTIWNRQFQDAGRECNGTVCRRWIFWIFSADSKWFFIRPPALCVNKSTVTLSYALDQHG